MKLYFSKCINRYFIADSDKILCLGGRSFFMDKGDIVRQYCDKYNTDETIDMMDGITKDVVLEFADTDELLTEFAEFLI